MSKRKHSPDESDEDEVRLRLTDLKKHNDEGPDQVWDEAFKKQVLIETKPESQKAKKQKTAPGETWGDKNKRMIHAVLKQATLPVVDTELDKVCQEAQPSIVIADSDDDEYVDDEGKKEPGVEALYLTPDQAYDYLASNYFHKDIPVIVNEGVAPEYKEQQERPIRIFFKWQEDLDRKLSVQVPSKKLKDNSYQIHTLQEVKETFLYKNKKNINDEEDEEFKHGEPWNVLDCQNPIPGTYPRFLQHRKCQLLHSIKSAALGGMTGQRKHISTAAAKVWKDNVKWTLLSEGGNLTGPHMDAHGLDTWITVQEGAFGFGWMARPTKEEYLKWLKDPLNLTESEKWRYLVLKPGQTIFFPSGLIHYVFRIKGYQTLASGGHNIRWNALERWLQVMTLQKQYPDSCNEDQDRINLFCSHVKRFIEQRIKHNTLEEVFGAEVPVWGKDKKRTAKRHAERLIQLIDHPDQPWNVKKGAGKKPAGKTTKK